MLNKKQLWHCEPVTKGQSFLSSDQHNNKQHPDMTYSDTPQHPPPPPTE